MSIRIPGTYEDYLKSEEWRQTRRRALYRAQNRCQATQCRLDYLRWLTDAELASEAMEYLPRHAYRLEVHHLTYERIGCEHPDDLLVLCPACHAAAHGTEHQDQPRTTTMAEAVIGAILAAEAAFKHGAPVDA